MQTRQSIHHALLQDSGNFISGLPAGSMAANGNFRFWQAVIKDTFDAIYRPNIAIIWNVLVKFAILVDAANHNRLNEHLAVHRRLQQVAINTFNRCAVCVVVASGKKKTTTSLVIKLTHLLTDFAGIARTALNK